ncbi:hypothetical protein LPUS_01931 [Lasallia pustulata]|uniref:Uncharacterized protein n=1 Tax=Lasallia pustulata TaxID=136370 RepID=A0A1W5CRL9_9LECA|nr:hypothetical protein LPUS_01931 [Lasallia pustulata]
MPPGYDASTGAGQPPLGSEYTQWPPRSRYYRTPTPSQAWDLSSVQDGGPTAEVQPRAANPPLPPRPQPTPSPGPSAPSRGHWPSGPAETGYPGHVSGPPPSAPPADQAMIPSYDPKTYGAMPGSVQPPSGPPTAHIAAPGVQSATSRWGVKYNQGQTYGVLQEPKPPLPPRPHSATQQGHGTYQAPAAVQSPTLDPSANHPIARLPQTASYNSLAPSVPNVNRFSWEEDTSRPPSSLDYSNRPPPPPPKLPQEHREPMQEGQHGAPQQFLYSTPPQTHGSEPETRMSNGLSARLGQRPENAYFNPPAWQNPPPPPSKDVAGDRSYIGQQLHQQSISPEGFEDGGHWESQSTQGQARPPYVSPANSTHSTLVHQYPYRDTASPEAFTSVGPSSRVPQESSYGAISAETSVSEPRKHFIDQEAVNPTSGKASHPTVNDYGESRPEIHGTTLAATVGGVNQVMQLRESPSHNAVIEGLSQAVRDHDRSAAVNNASALGIGGPSDWEYFGDYATEEVDDTELYGTSKPQASYRPPFDTAELPSEPSPSNEGHRQEAWDSVVAGAEQPHVSIPSPGDGTPPKQSTQPTKVSQSLEHQLRPPTPPLHSEVSKPAATENRGGGEGSLPNHGHSSDSKQGIHSTTESPAHHVEHGALSSLDSSSVQHPKPEDKKLDSNPAGNSDRKVARPLGESHMPSKLPSSQGRSEEKPFQSEVSPPIRESHTSRPPYHRQGDSSAPTLKNSNLHTSSVFGEEADAVADFDAWAKASLKRYVAMLRQEAQATTNEEKHKIFVTFTNRESRLRAVLYEAETDDRVPDSRASSIALVKDLGKPRPASPPTKEHSKLALADDAVTAPEVGDSHVESVTLPSDQKSTDPVPAAEPAPKEDSDTTIESPDNVQYSPGGRPIVTRPVNAGIRHYVQLAPAPGRKTPKIVPVQDAPPDTSEAHSPGSDAPMVVESEAADRGKQLEALNSITTRSRYPGIQRYISPPPTAPNRPEYTPLRHHDGDSESAGRSNSHQSIQRPYSAQRMGSPGGRFDVTRPLETRRRGTLNSPLVTKMELGEMLNGTTMDKTVPEILGVGPRKASLDPVPQVKALTSNMSTLASLEIVLPKQSIPSPDPPPLRNLKQAADAIVDDFSFIRKTVITWDTKAKELRERHDRARHSRQVESEERINGLFDEQQIGYGDISVLEAEFKHSEANKKAEEDRAEYETFSTDVFGVVWTRLYREIDQLTSQYGACVQILNDALAGKDMFEGFNSRPALAPAMELLLALHQKLENRHQKAFEAVLERNRRLKKIQVAPLYALGSINEVKRLERQFEDAEREAILDHCQKRAKRAHGLMDVLHQNTQRGLGANQDYMEAIMQAVRRIGEDAIPDPSGYLDDPGALRTMVAKAESVVTALTRSSEQVVQMFHVADKMLSASDYDVSVAEARLARADVAVFRQRGEEKAKEDLELVRDLEHRLALIRQGFKRTNDEIAKVSSIVQDEHMDKATLEDGLRPFIGTLDPSHEERLQKALEEAKRRNALRDAAVNNTAH